MFACDSCAVESPLSCPLGHATIALVCGRGALACSNHGIFPLMHGSVGFGCLLALLLLLQQEVDALHSLLGLVCHCSDLPHDPTKQTATLCKRQRAGSWKLESSLLSFMNTMHLFTIQFAGVTHEVLGCGHLGANEAGKACTLCTLAASFVILLEANQNNDDQEVQFFGSNSAKRLAGMVQPPHH